MFKFASLQSNFGQQQLEKIGLDKNYLYSLILLKDGQFYQRSDAALEIVKHLGGIWPLLYLFKVLPRFLRDGIYNWVARNRYQWFGKKDSCWLPSPELKSRFID
jgi:predicted DCC family thiol-disulfide oxidoreductase YuxK